jgi:oligosaccharide repeat unit polymerase
MGALCASCLLGLVLINYLLHRDLLYPGFVQALVWFVVVLLLIVNREAFIPVPDAVFVLLLAGVFGFGAGCFIASHRHVPAMGPTGINENSIPAPNAMKVLAVIVALGLIPYVARIIELSATGPSTSWYINLRYNASVNLEETGGIGRVSYFITLSYVLVAVALLRRMSRDNQSTSPVAVVLTIAIGLFYGVLSSGRGQVLTLLLIAIGIPLALRRVSPVRTALVAAVMGIILFVSIGIALGKGGYIGSTFGENLQTMKESVLTYLVGGVPALGTQLRNGGHDVDLGVNSLRSLFALAQSLGLARSAPPLVQDYIDVPMPVNVYTIYQPYIRDFGITGSVLVLSALGLVHGFIYVRATASRPKALWVFLFSVSLLPLLMQAFQDMYFSLLSLWMQYATYGIVLFVLFRETPTDLANSAARELLPAR